MAINRIPYPSSTPTAIADYEAQNALLVAALGEGNNVVPFIGTAMSIGFVFNVGGVVYRVDTATAISGTASPYVKITPSGATASASFSANLTGVTYNNVWNGYYDGSGNRYFFKHIAGDYPLLGGVTKRSDIFGTPLIGSGNVISANSNAIGVFYESSIKLNTYGQIRIYCSFELAGSFPASGEIRVKLNSTTILTNSTNAYSTVDTLINYGDILTIGAARGAGSSGSTVCTGTITAICSSEGVTL